MYFYFAWVISAISLLSSIYLSQVLQIPACFFCRVQTALIALITMSYALVLLANKTYWISRLSWLATFGVAVNLIGAASKLFNPSCCVIHRGIDALSLASFTFILIFSWIGTRRIRYSRSHENHSK